MTTRRDFLQTTAAAGMTMALPMAAQAQAGEGIRIGLLTVKTGPLASGGIDMERALVMYLAERNNMIAGQKVQLIVADTGGVPANAKSKVQELVELNKIHVLMGPLAAFEALAIDDYLKAQKVPTLSVAAADDMTQRKPNPWFVRATSSSSQCSHVMADHCAKTLKFKRMAMIADDIAYGHEMNAGFQRVFEENGGKIVQKMFPPLTAPDYGSFLAQLKTDVDGIFLGFAGSNGFRFVRQFNEYGLRNKMTIVGGMTALDESVLRNMGDEALGIQTVCWYSAELDNAINAKFAPAFRKQFSYDPGYYAAATYVNGAILEAAVKAIGGKINDRDALMAALKKTNVATARGNVKFDDLGNVVGDVYIRQVARKEGRLVNSVIKTYPNVSQFWNYDPKQFLANPVYSRDWPPAKNLES
ncbi:ABC transporter substrate-binding protein [Limnohabitans sp. JirII-29]|uniref:ABC transporter substrate-binding protein n=1 Tax=unclassified Limnohabitans TaxID=2626134 RepID=UPI000C1EE374|nr:MULTISPECIES: ABC transporter substrate-binding protein [unclassified Limnohabitans]PIT77400.1 ABC transporter substrate-binding protein [Limnohabitans sp. JirII-31]PUE28554.1 ABC transporter substrate-binding protein [Limnohabitans sp. JirII-29]